MGSLAIPFKHHLEFLRHVAQNDIHRFFSAVTINNIENVLTPYRLGNILN